MLTQRSEWKLGRNFVCALLWIWDPFGASPLHHRNSTGESNSLNCLYLGLKFSNNKNIYCLSNLCPEKQEKG